MNADALCQEMLPLTSRTFALTIPELPSPLRTTVGLAYLLCRIADTVEDQVTLPQAERLRRFALLRPLLSPSWRGSDVRLFEACWQDGSNHPDHALARRTHQVLAGLDEVCDSATFEIVFTAVEEMVDGMEKICRQTDDTVDHYPTLRSAEDLEEYCHYVAGTVGIMLTRLFARHMGRAAAFDSEARRLQGRDFGLGLQLTNILKDYADDYAAGRRFLPLDLLERYGVGDTTPAAGPLPLALRRHVAQLTTDRLGNGMAFIHAIPPRFAGLRIFCIWDLFLAMETLCLLASTPEGGVARKISRSTVYKVVDRGRALAADDEGLDAWFQQLHHEQTLAPAAIA